MRLLVSPFHAARLIPELSLLLAVVTLTGCGIGTSPVSPSASGLAINGRVMGGQQPISGAAISLYAAGLTGPGSGAVDLLRVPVTSGPDGSFGLTGGYTCPSSTTQVYLVGRGGNPGLTAGTNNPASVLMAPLGDCGNLSSSTFIDVDEITTVAGAWALSQFLAPGAIVGASPTNLTGLRNAFAVSSNLANTASGFSPGPTLPVGATVETAKLNTLADVLASCVNSDGGASCTSLFQAATVAGVAPSNTLDAALNIVRNPGSNVSAVFNSAPPSGPFQPVLANRPNDWSMSITYTGGGLSAPTAVAIDSTGSVWAANYFGTSVTKLSPTGQAAAPNGFADPVLFESYGLTIDAQDNVWVTNEEGDPANGNNGSLSKFSSSGTLLSGTGIAAGGIYYPYAIAADSNGTVWIADYGRSGASLLASDGTSIAGATGYSSPSLPLPVGVALDAAHNAWFAASGSAVKVSTAGVINRYFCCRSPSAIAVDQTGNVWVTDYSASALVELGADGTTLQHISAVGGISFPESLAIDGAGTVWVANYRGNSISEFGAASGGATSATLSPSTGIGVGAKLAEPFGIAADASGNLWITNFASDSLTQLVGIASPVHTPALGPTFKP
jgi:streptogramin lyase